MTALGLPGEAARLSASGRHAEASALLEEACDFAGAGREALLAGDARRAILLAALGGDEALCGEAARRLAGEPERALLAAGDLRARGFGARAARLFEAAGETLAAAEAFASAGEAVPAALAYEKAGRPADGAKALEAALRARPGDEASRLALGELLARHGRVPQAVRALQQIAPGSPERARALPLLARGLRGLGLEDAARSVDAELARLAPEAKGGEEAGRPSERRPPPPSSGKAPVAGRGGEPVLFGRYETLRPVASTPHARVFEAKDRITGEHVAVKIFASEGTSGRDARLRFEREARALAQLRHPSVVPMREYVPEGPAIVLAWMEGGSLADLAGRATLAPARAVEIAAAILGALGEAHRLGILHRDVKPKNILFDGVGAARLADFGAAHLGDLSNTATAGAIGTFAYMSPEQRLGRPATIASDLYGVGAVLYELLTMAAASTSADRGLLPPSAFNAELDGGHDAAVLRLLAEDPASRPADAFEARRLLEGLRWPERIPELRRPAPAPRPATEPPPASRRGRLAPRPGEGGPFEVFHDAWLGREILVVPLEDASLERARAYARAGHPSLPQVLRVDTEGRAIWVGLPPGRPLAAAGARLSPEAKARLREALSALTAAGGVHGAIDAEHVYLCDGEPFLAYPRRAGEASDLEALERLPG